MDIIDKPTMDKPIINKKQNKISKKTKKSRYFNCSTEIDECFDPKTQKFMFDDDDFNVNNDFRCDSKLKIYY